MVLPVHVLETLDWYEERLAIQNPDEYDSKYKHRPELTTLYDSFVLHFKPTILHRSLFGIFKWEKLITKPPVVLNFNRSFIKKNENMESYGMLNSTVELKAQLSHWASNGVDLSDSAERAIRDLLDDK